MPLVPPKTNLHVRKVALDARNPIAHSLRRFHVPREPKGRLKHGFRKVVAFGNRTLCRPFLFERPFPVTLCRLPPISLERRNDDRIARPLRSLAADSCVLDRRSEPSIDIPHEHTLDARFRVFCGKVNTAITFHERRHRRVIARIRVFTPLAHPVATLAIILLKKPCAEIFVRHEHISLAGTHHFSYTGIHRLHQHPIPA